MSLKLPLLDDPAFLEYHQVFSEPGRLVQVMGHQQDRPCRRYP